MWKILRAIQHPSLVKTARGICGLCHTAPGQILEGHQQTATAPRPTPGNPSGTLNPVSLLALHTDKRGRRDQHALQPVSNQYSLWPWIIHTIRKPLTPKPNELNAHLILFYYSQLRAGKTNAVKEEPAEYSSCRPAEQNNIPGHASGSTPTAKRLLLLIPGLLLKIRYKFIRTEIIKAPAFFRLTCSWNIY